MDRVTGGLFLNHGRQRRVNGQVRAARFWRIAGKGNCAYLASKQEHDDEPGSEPDFR